MNNGEEPRRNRDKPWSYRLIGFAMAMGCVALGLIEFFRHPFVFTRVAGVFVVALGLGFGIASLLGYGIRARGDPVEWPSERDLALGCLLRVIVGVLALLIALYLAWYVL